MTPTAIVAYLALFATVGFLFVLASLSLGSLLRISAPGGQKTETYECGEPAVGPGSVQFDLRFYVVALVFLIFEVEVALFFPPATVFGTANRMRAEKVASNSRAPQVDKAGRPSGTVALGDVTVHGDVLSSSGKTVLTPFSPLTPFSARTLALASMLDLGVFFAVLLVGFAYVWSRGDLDWVRAVRHPSATAETGGMSIRQTGGFRP
jgi:NADH-quinone oxidoreductase subunit A